ncbi:MAG: IS481 family transposase [Actinomycetota bacterium]|nr:IS481 family transposase [Actinomycetota bacterium]
MGVHANAKLGPAGRRELVRLIREGSTERQAAACLSVAPATAHRWSVRERDATAHQRASGAWALDKSSRPDRSPRRTPREVEQRVCAARQRTGWGPRLIAGETGVAHSTVHAILKRHGCSRAPRRPRTQFVRYEWPCPGDLLHIDVKRYPRFRRPGHAVTGDRRTTFKNKVKPLGHDYFHAIVDDHSRLAYGELLTDERAATTTAFVERALAWFANHGITARRVMTDGAWNYTRNGALRDLLTQREIRHIVTPPYTPRWNGKVERFHQTMEREWAKGLRYRNSTARNRALPHWLKHYNQRRPHSSLGGHAPISRAHNLSGQDS